MIYVEGDTHNPIDMAKLNTKRLPEQRRMTKEDCLIICGDTGLSEYLSKQEIRFEDIIDSHQRFEPIHSFQDGDCRVGRIIMFKECLKYNITPCGIITGGLKEYKTQKGYLLETCHSAQDTYKKMIEYFF
ncbi:hypothetical protein EDD76_111179 [Kineothrix alysoides]|uniref:Uncharacterized protein n=1 Tax=Kineothrix alysoides TaxID=1469948 RepID=A0A4R1QVR0_9FIRM|nr:hypothetical protein [Kineothrix alysoides]TCL56685.1 hypothetical protein EDD76_111179 [Kineothrix alysoides]